MMRRGFTLIEMLAAATLAAVLFVAVLSVVSSIGRERRSAIARSAKDAVPSVVELIRWDLANARQIQVLNDRVILNGNGALDRQTFLPTAPHPTTVMYQVRRVAGKSWLSRRQTSVDRQESASVELVCQGAAELRITRINSSEADAKATAADPNVLSSSIRLQIAWDDPHRDPVDRILVLR